MRQVTCGCSCHEINADDPNNVVLEDKTWNCLCALKESVRLLAKTKEAANKLNKELKDLKEESRQYQLLKEQLSELLCPSCFHKIGEEWVFAEGTIWCSLCDPNLSPK